jgi:ubiquinone/menaquinone biosynthesis C-methylase UbiE
VAIFGHSVASPCVVAFPLSSPSTHEEEADRLALLLNWQPDSTVADIGAGEGQMTLAVARRVGRVYTPDFAAKMPAQLEQIVAKEKDFTRG